MYRRRVLTTTSRYAAAFSTSTVLRQLQNREQTLGEHGSRLINHQSMASVSQDTLKRLPNMSTAFAPADLHRTKVHEGLGTSARDPYSRTLPNMVSETPEPTVMQSAANVSPSLEEIALLSKKSAKMQYWLGDRAPRLPLYLQNMISPKELPVSTKAEGLLAEFSTKVIPTLEPQRRAKVSALWAKAIPQFTALSQLYVLDREKFEAELAKLHGAALQECSDAAGGDERVKLALEVLRRKTVIDRNRVLRDQLIPFIEKTHYLGFGDSIWRIFFSAVEMYKAEVFGKEENKLLAFVWESLMLEDDLRTPALTAPVALYLTLLSIHVSPFLVDETHRERSTRLDSGLRPGDGDASAAASGLRRYGHLLSPTSKRRFATAALSERLQHSAACKAIATVLQRAGLAELSQDALLCETMNDDAALLRSDAESIVGLFENPAEVGTLLSSIMASTNKGAQRHVGQTFQIPDNHTAVWGSVLRDVDWAANWRTLAVTLLSSDDVLKEVAVRVRSNINAKGTNEKLLYSPEGLKQVSQVNEARDRRERTKQEKIGRLVDELTSFARVDSTLEMLQEIGVDMSPLQSELALLLDSLQAPRPTVSMDMLETALYSVCQRHPNWVKAGVLSGQRSLQNPSDAVEKMLRIFVRLTYVPQAGAASIAQHTRRRIGPVGTEPHQFNIPAEMGIVEQFDNLQYKRYDWQGWYQRMVDVHNRNVSIRCRIDDLKRLDGCGAPFVDLQTERRLRILSQERVGMGVIKLDSDKYEDQQDNVTYGSGKLSEIIADARKAQLGSEYWPSVEVKVRKPSGRSRAHYSLMDYDRIEKRSVELYAKYRDAKQRSLFVTPMDLWLGVKGMQVRKAADKTDEHGYTIENLGASMDEDNSDSNNKSTS